MAPTEALIDEIYRDKVRWAREQSIEEKILAGTELFDYACGITMAGIRWQNPGITEEEARQVLQRRLAFARRMELSA